LDSASQAKPAGQSPGEQFLPVQSTGFVAQLATRSAKDRPGV
jgi:hypothetical protein